jgi:hypothetical protein
MTLITVIAFANATPRGGQVEETELSDKLLNGSVCEGMEAATAAERVTEPEVVAEAVSEPNTEGQVRGGAARSSHKPPGAARGASPARKRLNVIIYTYILLIISIYIAHIHLFYLPINQPLDLYINIILYKCYNIYSILIYQAIYQQPRARKDIYYCYYYY